MAFVNHQFNLLLFISHIALNLMLIEVNIKKNVLCDIPFHLLIFMETISIAFISYFSIFGSGLLTRTSIFSPIISSASEFSKHSQSIWTVPISFTMFLFPGFIRHFRYSPWPTQAARRQTSPPPPQATQTPPPAAATQTTHVTEAHCRCLLACIVVVVL